MKNKIEKPCPICHKLETVQAFACVHEETCSVDYTVQCLGDCVRKRGKLGFFSPTLEHHQSTKQAAIKAWNNGEIDTKSKIYFSGNNYMGD